MGLNISVVVVAFQLWALESCVWWISSYYFCYRFRFDVLTLVSLLPVSVTVMFNLEKLLKCNLTDQDRTQPWVKAEHRRIKYEQENEDWAWQKRTRSSCQTWCVDCDPFLWQATPNRQRQHERTGSCCHLIVLALLKLRTWKGQGSFVGLYSQTLCTLLYIT